MFFSVNADNPDVMKVLGLKRYPRGQKHTYDYPTVTRV
jgi:hypothetical protein